MKDKNMKSLSVRLPLLLLLSLVITMAVVIPLVYYRFYNRMIDDYARLARGATNLMAEAVDGDKIEEYVEQNYELEEYREIVSYFKKLKENYPDILYIYVCRIEEDGGHIIFDLDAEGVENGEAYEVGYVFELEEPFASEIPNIMAGKETPGYAVHTQEDGFLYSYIRPIYRSDGSYACSACVDFSMDYVQKADSVFTRNLFLILLLIAVILFTAEVVIIQKWVTKPIDELSHCAEKFAYKTEDDRRNNIELLEKVNIHTGDEIETVYEMLKNVATDSYMATANLSLAINDILDKDEQISEISKQAYQDSLTNVGSSSAFRRECEMLDEEIEEDMAKFGLIIFDINNLKYVNDTCGHDRGNDYIKGCCKIICEHFKHSPVFRIGGDEFAVVLRSRDYAEREELLRAVEEEFEKAYHNPDARPWERYSASAGIAVFTPGDGSVHQVLKRADEQMYAAKEEFHRSHGNYR